MANKLRRLRAAKVVLAAMSPLDYREINSKNTTLVMTVKRLKNNSNHSRLSETNLVQCKNPKARSIIMIFSSYIIHGFSKSVRDKSKISCKVLIGMIAFRAS